MSRSLLLVAFALAALATATAGCRRTSEAERRQSDQATAEAEGKAQEASLTSATLDGGVRRDEMNAALRMEQSDYRGRLQLALDLLDREVVRARRGGEPRGRAHGLRARRSLLKADLVAVDRSTEQDWATLRTKVERDLETGEPGAQLPPRSDQVRGEAP